MDEVRKAAQRVVDGAEYPREMHRGYGTERLSLVPTDYLDALRAALARTQEAAGVAFEAFKDALIEYGDACAAMEMARDVGTREAWQASVDREVKARLALYDLWTAPRSPEQGAAPCDGCGHATHDCMNLAGAIDRAEKAESIAAGLRAALRACAYELDNYTKDDLGHTRESVTDAIATALRALAQEDAPSTPPTPEPSHTKETP